MIILLISFFENSKNISTSLSLYFHQEKKKGFPVLFQETEIEKEDYSSSLPSFPLHSILCQREKQRGKERNESSREQKTILAMIWKKENFLLLYISSAAHMA